MTKKHHNRDEINVVSGGGADFYEPFGPYNSILNFNHDPGKSDKESGTFMKTFKISAQGGAGAGKRESKRTVMNHFDTASSSSSSRRSNNNEASSNSYFISSDASTKNHPQHVHLRISIDHDNKNANSLINKSHLKATLNPMKSFYPQLSHHNDEDTFVSNRKSKRRTTTGDSGQQNTPDTISSVGSSGGRNVDGGLHSSRNLDRLIKMAGNWNSSKSRSSSVYSNVSVIVGNMATTPTKRMNSNSSSRDDPDYLMNNSMGSNNSNLFVVKRSNHGASGADRSGGRGGGGNFYPSHSVDEGQSDLISLASNIHVTYNDLSDFDKSSGRGDDHSKKANVSKQQKYRHRMTDDSPSSPAGSMNKVRFDKVSQYMIKAQ